MPFCLTRVHPIRWLLLASAISWIAIAQAGSTDLVISEIMSRNDSVLQDESGETPDWIEIRNLTETPVELAGWSLTDNPTNRRQWTFPEDQLEANGSLIVFASDKDQSEPGRSYHTNFKLNGSGEYLALVRPDGTVAHQFFPAFPELPPDVSFGLAPRFDPIRLITVGAAARYWIPISDEFGVDWIRPDFEPPESWLTGRTGIGFELGPGGFASVIATRVLRAPALFVRIPFDVADPETLSGLILRLQVDDGFVAFLNGQRIAAANAPALVQWNSYASGERPNSQALRFEEFDISDQVDHLVRGRNVLAIHVLNHIRSSPDLLLVPELLGVPNDMGGPPEEGRLNLPSPGAPNPPSFRYVLQAPRFSHGGGTFTQSFQLELSVEGEISGHTIRYTTDGTVPTDQSPIYTAPIRITGTQQIRARIFAPGRLPGPVNSQTYLSLASDVRSFTSDLPIVVLENFGAGAVPADKLQEAFMTIFEPTDQGRASLLNPADLQTRAGIKIRGSSTLNRPKKAYGIEAWDEEDRDKDIAPLGMPEESDWILYAPYNFDRALIRNLLMYELSNRIGRYAVRTRFCEVFVNTRGGSVDERAYVGVYVFMEKVKRGRERVDVEELLPEHNQEPWVTGGYMLKIDRLDPGDRGFSAGGQTFGYVEPKEREITQEQADWIRNYINTFSSRLEVRTAQGSRFGYEPFIDVDSWIDHHILNELSKNPDGLRLSTFLFKTRGGMLEYGPIWDFDRTMGCDDDDRARNPVGWSGDFTYGWWSRLFRDPDFWQRYIDRWQELRQSELTEERIHSVIDEMADEIREAQARNFQKWPLSLGRNGWQGKVDSLKDWIARRLVWIDSEFPAPPAFSLPGGAIRQRTTLSLAAADGEIFYTLDGSDPRRSGGLPSDSAIPYSAAGISLPADRVTLVTARVRGGREFRERWSAMKQLIFSPGRVPALAVSELMFNPPPPPPGSSFDNDDFEFIEIVNAGDAGVDLAGMHLREGVQFDFAPHELRPGETILLVKNQAAFQSRYGSAGARIAGEYAGKLGNGGDRIVLLDAAGRTVFDLTYGDGGGWPRASDGGGASLELLDPQGDLSRASNWRSSALGGGTPGQSHLEIVRLQPLQLENGQLRLRFECRPGGRYQIYRRAGFGAGSWTLFQVVTAGPDDSVLELRNPVHPDEPAQFFRVRP